MKHDWYMDDGEIDTWRYMQGEYHNGPECKRCGFAFCHHCNPEGYDTKCGDGTSLPADDAKLDVGIVALAKSLRGRP